jgi:zinc protease
MTRRLLAALALAAGLRAQAPPLPPPQLKTPPAAAPARTATPKEAVYPPLHAVQLPRMASVQLPNGLKLYLIEDHELPVIQGAVAVRAGGAFDPADRPGLARLTLHALRSSSVTATGADREEMLDRLGVRMEEMFSETSCGFSFTAPRESSEEVLKVLDAMVAEPVFQLGKLEVAKAIGRSVLKRRDGNSAEAAMREFQSVLYGRDSAFGRQESEAGIAQMRLDDVTQFYRRYFVPQNTALALQGDFDPAAMRTLVERLFGGWTVDQGRAAELPKPAAAAPAAWVIQARNVLRVHLILGQVGVGLQERDAAAWEVLATLLGGTSHSRLLDKIRSPVPGDNLELGAQWITRLDRAGILSIEASCAAPGLTAVLEGIRNEFKRLSGTPVTEEEARGARDAVLAKLAGAFDTKLKRLNNAQAGEMAGLPPDWASRHQEEVAAVTRADLDRLARTLDPAKFTIVAIGDTEDIQQRLKAFGRDATILAAKPAPGAAAAAAQPDPQTVEQGRRLMARAQEASGGAAKVAELKDATLTAAFEQGPSAGGGRQVLTQRWLLPGHFREETAASPFAAYTNGEAGFVTDGIRSNPLSGPTYEQIHKELFQFYPRLLLGDALPGRTLFAVDGNAVELREGARSGRLVFDQSGLPSEILYEVASSAGLPVVVEELLEDFRPVGGVKMPFRIRILQNGQPASLVTVQELKVNSGLKVEDLMKRQ